MFGNESQVKLRPNELGAITLAVDINHVVGTLETVLTRPANATALYLVADVDDFRVRLGDRLALFFTADDTLDELTVFPANTMELLATANPWVNGDGPINVTSDTDLPGGLNAGALNLLDFDTNPLDGDTVTLGTQTYTFQTTLTNVDGNVLIGVDNEASMLNFVSAIMLAAGAGTIYAAATVVNALATATQNGTSAGLVARAKIAGELGNSIITTTTGANVWTIPLGTMLNGRNTDYFIVGVEGEATKLKLATSRADALAVPAVTVNITSVGSGIHTIGGMPPTVAPIKSEVRGEGGLAIVAGAKPTIITAPDRVTVKGYTAGSVLTYWWV